MNNQDIFGKIAYPIASKVVANVSDASADDVLFSHGDGLGTIRIGATGGTLVVITQQDGDVAQFLSPGEEYPHLIKGIRAAGSDAIAFTAWR